MELQLRDSIIGHEFAMQAGPSMSNDVARAKRVRVVGAYPDWYVAGEDLPTSAPRARADPSATPLDPRATSASQPSTSSSGPSFEPGNATASRGPYQIRDLLSRMWLAQNDRHAIRAAVESVTTPIAPEPSSGTASPRGASDPPVSSAPLSGPELAPRPAPPAVPEAGFAASPQGPEPWGARPASIGRRESWVCPRCQAKNARWLRFCSTCRPPPRRIN